MTRRTEGGDRDGSQRGHGLSAAAILTLPAVHWHVFILHSLHQVLI